MGYFDDPRLSPDGLRVLSGRGLLYLDGSPILAGSSMIGGLNARWLTSTTIVFCDLDGYVRTHVLGSSVVSPRWGPAVNDLAAGGGVWLGARSDERRIYRSDGRPPIEDAYAPAVSADGQTAWLTSVLTEHHVLFANDWPLVDASTMTAVQGPFELPSIGAYGAVWSVFVPGGKRTWGQDPLSGGQPLDTHASYQPWEFAPIAVNGGDGQLWVFSNDLSRVLLRPAGERLGYVVRDGATAESHWKDAKWVSAWGVYRCVWTNPDGSLGDVRIRPSDARVDLQQAPPLEPEVEPINHPMGAGYFFGISDRFGDNPDLPGTWQWVETLAEAERAYDRGFYPVLNEHLLDHALFTTGAGYVGRLRRIWDRVPCFYLSTPNDWGAITDLDAKARFLQTTLAEVGLPVRPSLGLVDHHRPVRWPDTDYLAPELYSLRSDRPDGETLDESVNRFIELLQSAARTGKPLVPVWQAYRRSSGAPGDVGEPDLEKIDRLQYWLPLLVNQFKCRAFLWFSDGRASGTRDYEQWRPVHRAIVATIPGVPPVETLGGSEPPPIEPPPVEPPPEEPMKPIAIPRDVIMKAYDELDAIYAKHLLEPVDNEARMHIMDSWYPEMQRLGDPGTGPGWWLNFDRALRAMRESIKRIVPNPPGEPWPVEPVDPQ